MVAPIKAVATRAKALTDDATSLASRDVFELRKMNDIESPSSVG